MKEINLTEPKKTIILAFLDNPNKTDNTPEKIAKTIYTHFESNPELADDESFLINIATKNLDVFSELIEPIYKLNPTVVGDVEFYKIHPEICVDGKVNIIYQAAKRDALQKKMNEPINEDDKLKKKIFGLIKDGQLPELSLTEKETSIFKRLCQNARFIGDLAKRLYPENVLKLLADSEKNNPHIWNAIYRGSYYTCTEFLHLDIPDTIKHSPAFWKNLFKYSNLTIEQFLCLDIPLNIKNSFSFLEYLFVNSKPKIASGAFKKILNNSGITYVLTDEDIQNMLRKRDSNDFTR